MCCVYNQRLILGTPHEFRVATLDYSAPKERFSRGKAEITGCSVVGMGCLLGSFGKQRLAGFHASPSATGVCVNLTVSMTSRQNPQKPIFMGSQPRAHGATEAPSHVSAPGHASGRPCRRCSPAAVALVTPAVVDGVLSRRGCLAWKCETRCGASALTPQSFRSDPQPPGTGATRGHDDGL
jgi:hypothetical protein